MTVVASTNKLEKLTTLIQEKLSGNPAILVGSGGSIPYGLPSMHGLSVEIENNLGSKYSTDSEWIKFKKELEKQKDFEKALGCVNISDIIHADIIDAVWNIINKKDSEAYLNFIKSGMQPALTKIIRKFLQRAGSTTIVTTNYDKIIEYSIDFAKGEIEDGFSGKYHGYFNGSSSSNRKRTVNLFKVHGSIDWFKNKFDQSLFSTNSSSILSLDGLIPMIVTPGNNKYKETHSDPFRTVMANADVALKKSMSFLCIGYGFNDDHIQPIVLEENRDKNKPIVIITKSITDRIRSIFLGKEKRNCIIISENSSGGTIVNYSETEFDVFSENYWLVDDFYNLWLE